ncbi:MAG TPA: transcriptional activator NhaR [Terriglobia bacterium]|nr:transcriptional activator NhaR [Terriglobia bacterium]
MEWLNYHHLFYFWVVARRGSIVKASEELLLAPPTISAQISQLEDYLGEKLFTRTGRRLVLTEVGKIAYGYAQEIFSLGRELTDTLKGRPTGRALKLQVGVADVLPKRLAYRLIEPALHLASPVRVICREDPPDRLLALLALHEIDLILSDAPFGPGISVRAYNHPLGECGAGFYARPKLAAAYRRKFPRSLNGAPFLLPTASASMRSNLDQWFEAEDVRPVVTGEFEDFTLLRAFAEGGHGIFAAPRVLDRELRRNGFGVVGYTEEVRARFYAISVERRVKNPAVIAICDTAREKLFG